MDGPTRDLETILLDFIRVNNLKKVAYMAPNYISDDNDKPCVNIVLPSSGYDYQEDLEDHLMEYDYFDAVIDMETEFYGEDDKIFYFPHYTY